MADTVSLVYEIISQTMYMTIATADEKGQPWNTPVFCAFDSQLNFYWSSHPESQHSRNIQTNNGVFIVLYNSTAAEGNGIGVYIQAQAAALETKEVLEPALVLLGKRRGKPFEHLEKFIGQGSQRIYKAEPQKVWINDADKDNEGDFIRDYRVEVPIKDIQKVLV